MIEETADAPPSLGRRLGLVLATAVATFAIFWAIMPNQFADPFVRHDDFPALFGDERLFYWKTLTEGRWLNYAWHLRPWPYDRELLYALYMALWCLGFAFVAAAIFRDDRSPWRILIVGFALAAMPQGGMISGWHNTLIPANLLIVLYAAIVAFAPARVAVWSLFAFVPVTLMAYTTYPLILLAIAMIGIDWRGRSFWEPLWIGIGFCIAFAVGVLTIYAVNWVAFGVFGLQFPAWREANEARDLAAVWANISTMGNWWSTIVKLLTLKEESGWIGYGLAVFIAVIGIGSRSLTTLAAIVIALGVSVGFVLSQRGLTGIELPARSTGMLWVISVGLFALALRTAPTIVRKAVFGGIVLLQGALSAYAFWWLKYETDVAEYQRISAEIAATVDERLGTVPETLVVVGNAYSLEPAAVLHNSVGLSFRLKVLTGRAVAACDWDTFGKSDSEASADPETRADPDANTDPDVDTAADPVSEPAEAEPLSIDPYYTDWDAMLGKGALCDTHGEALRNGPKYPAEGSIRWLGDGVAGIAFDTTDLRD